MSRLHSRSIRGALSGSLLAVVVGLSVGGCPASPGTSGAGRLDSNFKPTLDLRLSARSVSTQIFAGAATQTLTYAPEVIDGDAARVAAMPGSYLGPIIRVQRGDRLRVRLQNELDEATIIHWHGMRVPAEQDGHPSEAIGPGDEFVYEFEVRNRAGTYWFHPHSHGTTASQVYAGLAGLLLVSDDEETAIGLPTGEFDIPLVIQDRMFDADNQLVYPPHAGRMMDGFLGDTILVNGRPSYQLNAATRAYRLRLINGSNSRTYKLAWNDGTPLVAIATDGGLLGAPMEREYLTLAPGERVEVWADFSGRAVGTQLALESLEFSGADIGMEGMADGMDHVMQGMKVVTGTAQTTADRPNGAAFTVMNVLVDRAETETHTLPASLAKLTRYRLEDAVNADSPREFAVTVGMGMGMTGMGMRWGFNGRQFSETGVSANERIPFDQLELWDLVNETAPMVMSHPIHIHGAQFQVLSRSATDAYSTGWESVRRGYVDEGWKDTVLLMPGERLRLLVRFSDFRGTYVYHCHNLEHSDGGMMRNLRVE
ncbi:MAG: multicopper oxidase family protein [Phycisphaerales bacterium]|nr:multicopper oxidase family protein [Phycisphaerales bacterium]